MGTLIELWHDSRRRLDRMRRIGVPEERLSKVKTAYDEKLTEALARTDCEKVVFWQTIPDILRDMTDNGQVTAEMVMRSVRLPSDLVWVEYRATSDSRAGVLFVQEELGVIRSLVVYGLEGAGSEIVYAVTFPQGLPMRSGEMSVNSHSVSDDPEHPSNTKGGDRDLKVILQETLFALFLLQQPKVYTDEVREPSPRLQKKRLQAGRERLPTYRSVTLHLGPVPRRGTSLEQTVGQVLEGQGRRHRYHHVLGHFRMYNRDSAEPKVVWIEPYFRGDPELGIVNRERRVTVKKD